VSGSPPSRMPSAFLGPDPRPERPGDRWRTAGLALLALWSAFFVVGVALWVRVAFFAGGTDDPHGYVLLFGAPFVLVALGLLWWAWWSARALLGGRREGWTLLLVLGGVAVAQSVMTAPAVVASSTGPGTPGVADSSGPPRELLAAMLGAIGFGLVTIVVAVLARRSWAAADAGDAAKAAPPADGVTAPG